MKILAVGDVHTKTWIIEEVEKLVDDYDAIVFCGDYADNWNTSPSQTLATWRLMKIFAESYFGKVHAVVGNHDYAYLHPEISGRSSGWNPTTQMLINSPENRKLKNWLLSLPPIIELDGVTFSHAGVTEEWDGDTSVMGLWNDVSPIWARPYHYGGNIVYKNIVQVFGHNPHETCSQLEENVWCIDTFSEHRDNTPIGDQTVLEIINTKQFNIKKLKNENNSSSANLSDSVS